MSIAVIGLGGIGSAFAHRLALAGHAVTAVARPGSRRLQQLQCDRGVVPRLGERAEMKVADGLDEHTAYDLVIVTMLAHQVDSLLPALERSRARCIHFMFNTFDPERLRDTVGGDRCSFGMPFIMASLDSDGTLSATVTASRKTLHSDQRWVDLFVEAGVPSAFERKMLLWLRCHVPLCVAMESISVAGQRRGSGASWMEAVAVARGVRGGFAIIKGFGFPLYPPAKAALNASPTVLVASMLWFVSRIASFRDLLATGLNECRALVDVLATAARDARPPVPEAANAVLTMKPAEEAALAQP